MQDVTSNSSDDIIAITCAVPGPSWGWLLAVEGAVIIPAMMITTTTTTTTPTARHSQRFLRPCENGETPVGNLGLARPVHFKWRPQDRCTDSFGCLGGNLSVWGKVTQQQADTVKGVTVLVVLVIATH